MKKKFICPVCGFVFEGEEAPERCPQCKQIVEWKVVDETTELNFVTEHVVGIAKGTGDDMLKDLNAHFMGEATKVGTHFFLSTATALAGQDNSLSMTPSSKITSPFAQITSSSSCSSPQHRLLAVLVI